MFGKIVLDVPGDLFEEALHDLVEEKGLTVDTELSADDLARTRRDVQGRSCATEAGVDFPDDPHRAARLRDRSRVQVVERPARARLPPDGEASPTISAPR